METDRPAVCMPDYTHCLTNVSGSLLHAFGVEAPYPSIPKLDLYLAAPVRNIILLLLDGMGTAIMEKHLDPAGFFASHRIDTLSSVYPPTTVAATTSLLSGLTPAEHGWLGWDLFYKELGENVTVFENTYTGTHTAVGGKAPASWTYTPYHSIIHRIQEAGFHAYYAAAHEQPYPQGLDGVLERASRLCELKQRKLIYTYWGEPDHTMHKTGNDSEETHTLLKTLERRIEDWSSTLRDAVLIIVADHGHINIRGESLEDHPDLADTLVREPSVEARAVNFFVKPEEKERFVSLFHTYYGADFRLLDRGEALELLGGGTVHPRTGEILGDYLAVATGERALFPNRERAAKYLSHHAGLTRDEMEIPLIVVNRP